MLAVWQFYHASKGLGRKETDVDQGGQVNAMNEHDRRELMEMMKGAQTASVTWDEIDCYFVMRLTTGEELRFRLMPNIANEDTRETEPPAPWWVRLWRRLRPKKLERPAPIDYS